MRGAAMISYVLPADAATVKLMCDLMPDGTIVTFDIPLTDAVAPQPPVDYAANPEPWEEAA